MSDDVLPTTAELELSMHRLAAPGGAQCACAKAPGGCAAAPADEGGPVWSKNATVAVPALNAALAVNASAAELLAAMPDCTPSSCFLRVRGAAAATRTKPAASSGADLFFAPFKGLGLRKPSLSMTDFKAEAGGRVSFEVGTDAAAALLVVVESELRGRFSDNMVSLPPCGRVRLTFTPARGVKATPEALKKSLSVASLYEHQTEYEGDAKAAKAPVEAKGKEGAAAKGAGKGDKARAT